MGEKALELKLQRFSLAFKSIELSGVGIEKVRF
jgi:hypothetical protein